MLMLTTIVGCILFFKCTKLLSHITLFYLFDLESFFTM
jgi:hypothetical protein